MIPMRMMVEGSSEFTQICRGNLKSADKASDLYIYGTSRQLFISREYVISKEIFTSELHSFDFGSCTLGRYVDLRCMAPVSLHFIYRFIIGILGSYNILP